MLPSDIYTAKLCAIAVDEAHVIKFSIFSMKIIACVAGGFVCAGSKVLLARPREEWGGGACRKTRYFWIVRSLSDGKIGSAEIWAYVNQMLLELSQLSQGRSRHMWLIEESVSKALNFLNSQSETRKFGINRKTSGIFRSVWRSKGTYRLKIAWSALTALKNFSGNWRDSFRIETAVLLEKQH